MNERDEVVVKVDGMRDEGCAEAVRRAIRALDPHATVQIDRERGQVSAHETRRHARSHGRSHQSRL